MDLLTHEMWLLRTVTASMSHMADLRSCEVQVVTTCRNTEQSDTYMSPRVPHGACNHAGRFTRTVTVISIYTGTESVGGN